LCFQTSKISCDTNSSHSIIENCLNWYNNRPKKQRNSGDTDRSILELHHSFNIAFGYSVNDHQEEG